MYAQQTPDLTSGLSVDSAQNILGCPPDSAQIYLARIQFEGNRITQEKILRAELDLHEGNRLNGHELKKRLESNRRRLYNLQLFHYVRYIALCDVGALTLIFTVQERWYIWPIPKLDLFPK